VSLVKERVPKEVKPKENKNMGSLVLLLRNKGTRGEGMMLEILSLS